MTLKKTEFLRCLNEMSKKGSYDIFLYIKDNEGSHYSDILAYALGKKIISSRSSLPKIIRNFNELNMIERNVIDTNPVRTTYKLSKRGHMVSRALNMLNTAF